MQQRRDTGTSRVRNGLALLLMLVAAMAAMRVQAATPVPAMTAIQSAR